MAADYGAYLPDSDCRAEPTGCGALHGLTFAVKDLIDVAGHVTGGGNPDWAAAQQPAVLHAPAVARLLAAGARLRGKTISDELAFSLEGENAHYGTPRNPRCPGRLPGGSSSGSAVAVAAGLNDLALGTDTGGSVRVPASFCGIYGFRPSHGRVPLAGVVPFAPSYDTVGLFAGSARHLALAGRVLLGSLNQTTPMPPPITRFYHATDAFALAQPATATALPRLGEAVTVFDGAEADWLEAYRVLQGIEIKASLGPWIARAAPRFGANIAPRFTEALALSETDAAQWRPRRAAFAARLHALLPPGSALLLPSAPGPALPCDADGVLRGEFYRAALTLGSLAGHAGLPALSLPGTLVAGCPVGLSIIAGPGQDEALLAFAVSNALEHDVIML